MKNMTKMHFLMKKKVETLRYDGSFITYNAMFYVQCACIKLKIFILLKLVLSKREVETVENKIAQIGKFLVLY